ncbi:hypothetical protein SEPCBS119000_006707 [Sporothrix epigloea]|uniref:Uncharacterized protein n=1 Tax=Sporothrix epigloea TaxID=1892477 RepID=A0ABP0E4F5_9PEZI
MAIDRATVKDADSTPAAAHADDKVSNGDLMRMMQQQNALMFQMLREMREERLARANTASTTHVAVDMAAMAPVVVDLAETAAATATTTAIPTMAPITVSRTEKAAMAVVPASETVATPDTLCTEKAATLAALPTEPTATTDTSSGITLVIKNKASKGSRDDSTVARNAHGGDNIARSNRHAADAHVSASRKQLANRPFSIGRLSAPVDTGLIRMRRRKKRHKDADAGDHIAQCGALRNNGCSPCTTPKSMVNKAVLASTPITTVQLKGVGGFGPSIDYVATFDLWSTLRDSPKSVFVATLAR